MRIQIDNFDDLIVFLKRPDTTLQMVHKIATEGLKVIILDNELAPFTKEQSIQILRDWWLKYGLNQERPIFIPKIDFEYQSF